MRLGATLRGIWTAADDEALAGAQVRAFARHALVLFISLCVNAVAVA